MSQTAVDSDTEVRKLLPPPGLYRTKEKLVLHKVRSEVRNSLAGAKIKEMRPLLRTPREAEKGRLL